MLLVLVFACVLLASVLVSGLANRSVLSTAVLFLTAGFLLGDGVSGAIEVRADQNFVASLADSPCSACCSPTACASNSPNSAPPGGSPAAH